MSSDPRSEEVRGDLERYLGPGQGNPGDREGHRAGGRARTGSQTKDTLPRQELVNILNEN